MVGRWHRYYQVSTKQEATKIANQIRRHSAHRNSVGFKVRVRAFGRKGQRFPKRGYVVEWYGAKSAM